MTFSRTGITGAGGRNFDRANATGSAAMAESYTMDGGDKVVRLARVTLHMSDFPSDSEDFTITINSDLGEAYDTLFYALDLSTSPTKDLVLTSDDFGDIMFVMNNAATPAPEVLDFAYANTGTDTWGLTVLFEVL
jgi:hypothetical protein